MIPIKIEATNPSNIGGFKNTPNTNPALPKIHDKPEKGSYLKWIESELKESRQVCLESSTLTDEELLETVKSAILQDSRYPYIEHWLDNDTDEPSILESNENELNIFIQSKLFPKINQFCIDNRLTTISISDIMTLCRHSLVSLNASLESQYKGGV